MAGNNLKSLARIFNRCLFRIPDFQRGYSWQKPQLADFWEDLENLEDDRIHYTGMLTVEPVAKGVTERNDSWQDDRWLIKDGYTPYSVIDGQQRLTTAIILINEILAGFEDDETLGSQTKAEWTRQFLHRSQSAGFHSYLFGYEKDDRSNEFFKTRILGMDSPSADNTPDKTLYTANLEAAKAFFAEKIADCTKEELAAVFGRTVHQFRFNFYEIDDELDIYVTFETMNNRGKPLSNLELLKNRFIYLATLIKDKEVSRRLRNTINERWKTIYENLGFVGGTRLRDDDFLRDHWCMYYWYNRDEAGSYAKSLLNEEFTARRLLNPDEAERLTPEDIKDYADSLAKASRYWVYLRNPDASGYGPETMEWLQKLTRVGMSAFRPLLMAAMMNETEEARLLALFREVERFLFLVFQASNRKANTKNSHYYHMAHNYYWDEVTLDDVLEDIRWFTDGGEGDPDADDYEHHGLFDVARFKIQVEDLYKGNGEGFYHWRGLRYFLYEYELHLQHQERGNTIKVTWADYGKRKRDETIEHVFPRKPKSKDWKQFKSIPPRNRKRLLHSLGNLLLLSQRKNASLQNGSFKEKKDGTETRAGYYNGSHSEIQISRNTQWTPAKIARQGTAMLEFMQERWGFDIRGYKGMTELEFLGLKANGRLRK